MSTVVGFSAISLTDALKLNFKLFIYLVVSNTNPRYLIRISHSFSDYALHQTFHQRPYKRHSLPVTKLNCDMCPQQFAFISKVNRDCIGFALLRSVISLQLNSANQKKTAPIHGHTKIFKFQLRILYFQCSDQFSQFRLSAPTTGYVIFENIHNASEELKVLSIERNTCLSKFLISCHPLRARN